MSQMSSAIDQQHCELGLSVAADGDDVEHTLGEVNIG